jgi:hypothetical protein
VLPITAEQRSHLTVHLVLKPSSGPKALDRSYAGNQLRLAEDYGLVLEPVSMALPAAGTYQLAIAVSSQWHAAVVRKACCCLSLAVTCLGLYVSLCWGPKDNLVGAVHYSTLR